MAVIWVVVGGNVVVVVGTAVEVDNVVVVITVLWNKTRVAHKLQR